MGWFLQSARDLGVADTSCERIVSHTVASSIVIVLRVKEDQECMLCLGGDLLGGDRRRDLFLGERRLWLTDLTMTECRGDQNLDGRGLIPLLLRVGEGS